MSDLGISKAVTVDEITVSHYGHWSCELHEFTWNLWHNILVLELEIKAFDFQEMCRDYLRCSHAHIFILSLLRWHRYKRIACIPVPFHHCNFLSYSDLNSRQGWDRALCWIVKYCVGYTTTCELVNSWRLLIYQNYFSLLACNSHWLFGEQTQDFPHTKIFHRKILDFLVYSSPKMRSVVTWLSRALLMILHRK